jgi:protein-tyrosine-phosphatase
MSAKPAPSTLTIPAVEVKSTSIVEVKSTSIVEVKSTSSQLAMDQMQRRSESMATLMSQADKSLLPSSPDDDPDFTKVKKGCDINMTPARPLIVVKDKATSNDVKVEEELADPWSSMQSAKEKTNKMIRSTTVFG